MGIRRILRNHIHSYCHNFYHMIGIVPLNNSRRILRYHIHSCYYYHCHNYHRILVDMDINVSQLVGRIYLLYLLDNQNYLSILNYQTLEYLLRNFYRTWKFFYWYRSNTTLNSFFYITINKVHSSNVP